MKVILTKYTHKHGEEGARYLAILMQKCAVPRWSHPDFSPVTDPIWTTGEESDGFPVLGYRLLNMLYERIMLVLVSGSQT